MSKSSNTNDSRVVRLGQASKYLKHHAKAKQPTMVWGPPGVGKSEMIAALADELPPKAGTQGLGTKQVNGKTVPCARNKLIDVRLPLWDPTDIKGIPFYNPTNNTMEWAQPSELPNALDGTEYDNVVLFLDELNGAAPAVQAAAYQLILNRRVGTYTLPDNVVIFAAGNRETDKGVTYRMPKPLANRMLHYEVYADFNDWANWAINNEIDANVVGYLSCFKDDLYRFDPSSPDRSFATPRSWVAVSRLLQDADGLTQSDITEMVVAAIGQGTALKFDAHRAVSKDLPNPTLILEGKVKKLTTSELSAKYALSTSILYELREKFISIDRTLEDAKGAEYVYTTEMFEDMLNNALTFMMDNFEDEMNIMAARALFTQYKITGITLTNLKIWPRFLKEYGHLIKDA